MIKLPASAALVCIMIFIGTLSAEEVVDSICAAIDDEIILESEVAYGISVILLERKFTYPSQAQIEEIRGEVLDAFITQKVLLARAHEETLSVEDRVVDRELDRKLQTLINQVGGQDNLVEYFGKPLVRIKREMRKGVRDDLLIEMLKQQHFGGLDIRRQEVKDFFEINQWDLPVLPERVDISHILLEIHISDESRAKAFNRITEIRNLLVGGADFDSIARLYSEDPSAEMGGRFGFTNRGDLVPEYEEAAYELAPMEISDIVESKYGFHIIRLLERQGERISTQHILIMLDFSPEDRQSAIQQAEQLRTRIYQNEDFADLARQYSEDYETAANGGKLDNVVVADLPLEIRSAIDALGTGEVSPPVETPFGVHIVRLNKRYLSRTMNLSQDWQTIEQYALGEKRESMFREWVEKLKKNHYIWP